MATNKQPTPIETANLIAFHYAEKLRFASWVKRWRSIANTTREQEARKHHAGKVAELLAGSEFNNVSHALKYRRDNKPPKQI